MTGRSAPLASGITPVRLDPPGLFVLGRLHRLRATATIVLRLDGGGEHMRDFVRMGLIALLCGVLFGQSADKAPEFEIADVHVAANTPAPSVRLGAVRNGRYEIYNGTMLDMISTAWGVEPDKVVGGPNWLELDRFDVAGKLPAHTAAETQKLMLQTLLKDRFKLVLHEETKPVPAWTLTAGRKVLMKEAEGAGETGCKAPSGGGPGGGGGFFIANPNGTTLSIGPGNMIQYSCRNMTMAAFSEALRSMIFVQIDTPVRDQTGLKGRWNFDLKYSIPLPFAENGERISVAEAIEKQLGLKLEQTPVPQAVLVVDSVERQPSPNPPGIKDALPEIPAPTEFEVADVKLANGGPGFGVPLPMKFQMDPGGRFVAEDVPMRFLIDRAFNVNNEAQIAGLPNWVDSTRVSITAKVSADVPAVRGPFGDSEFLAPLLRSLLRERFGLVWHAEQRNGTAYSLVAAKPKLKRADPNSRIFCRTAAFLPGAAPGEQTLACQNATIALLSEQLRNFPGINASVQDATGLEGGWDFTLSFNPFPRMMLNGPGRGLGDPAPGGAPVASDPGGGYTISESIEKQLGLKLESQKRPVPVIVIDKLNQKPTEN